MKDKPEVKSNITSPYVVTKGQPATFECILIDANPNTSISWRWFRDKDIPSNVLTNGHIYMIPNMQRNNSGTYGCTASNYVGTSDPVTIYVDVRCKYSHIRLLYCLKIF